MQASFDQGAVDAMGERTERSVSHSTMTNRVATDPRSARILAKAIYKEARSAGVEGPGLVAIASELLSLVAEEMKAARQ